MTQKQNEEKDIVENEPNTGRRQMMFSVVWAALIIASALVIKDNKAATIMLFLLVGGWAATAPYVGGFKKMMACERRAMRRFMGLNTTAK